MSKPDAVSHSFARFLVSRGALKIAPDEAHYYALKSGRKSPVFANLGSLIDGEALDALAEAYADRIAALLSSGELPKFEYLFGPAYKGIPLAAITAAALWRKYQMKVRFLYDRKELKAHGDVKADALVVGADKFKFGSPVLMIDDVITTGAAKIEAWEKMESALAKPKLIGILVAIDRQESGGDSTKPTGEGAAQEVQAKLGCPVFAIAAMGDLYHALAPTLSPGQKEGWKDYFKKWGNRAAKEWACRLG